MTCIFEHHHVYLISGGVFLDVDKLDEHNTDSVWRYERKYWFKRLAKVTCEEEVLKRRKWISWSRKSQPEAFSSQCTKDILIHTVSIFVAPAWPSQDQIVLS